MNHNEFIRITCKNTVEYANEYLLKVIISIGNLPNIQSYQTIEQLVAITIYTM